MKIELTKEQERLQFLEEKVAYYERRDAQLFEFLTEGKLSYPGYELNTILNEVEMNFIRKSDFDIYFSDLKDIDLVGEDLIDYLEKVYEDIYKELSLYGTENLLTFNEIRERIKVK